jgi:hypothetical protein
MPKFLKLPYVGPDERNIMAAFIFLSEVRDIFYVANMAKYNIK